MSGVALLGAGLLTGWGPGLAALPAEAGAAAAGRTVIAVETPRLDGDRFRRATRECLLAVAAVDALLTDAGLSREAIEGGATALIYVTAGAYGASNRAFVESAAPGTLHFPYTAASAVPAEVSIEFGLTGRYLILIGGAATTIDALWQAGRLVSTGACQRALVLAVETFTECADLWRRSRWLLRSPLVEAAGCVLLGAGRAGLRVGPGEAAAGLERTTARRAGETLACEPLVALALARASGEDWGTLTGHWRGRRAVLTTA